MGNITTGHQVQIDHLKYTAGYHSERTPLFGECRECEMKQQLQRIAWMNIQ